MAHSGQNGDLYLDGSGGRILGVENITLDDSVLLDSYHANDTGGRKAKVVGVGDANGSFKASKAVAAQLSPGTKGTLFIWTGTDGESKSLDIAVQRVALAVDVSDGTRTTYDVTFEGDASSITTGAGSAPA